MEKYVVIAQAELEESRKRSGQKTWWTMIALVALTFSGVILCLCKPWEVLFFGWLVWLGCAALFAMAFLELLSEIWFGADQGHFVPVAFQRWVAYISTGFFIGLLLVYTLGLLA
jgi:hypothetical protein